MELESEILTLNLEGALKLANKMKFDESSIKDKSRFIVSKFIRDAVEERVSNIPEKPESIEYLKNIKAFFGPLPLGVNSEEPESNEEESQKKRKCLHCKKRSISWLVNRKKLSRNWLVFRRRVKELFEEVDRPG